MNDMVGSIISEVLDEASLEASEEMAMIFVNRWVRKRFRETQQVHYLQTGLVARALPGLGLEAVIVDEDQGRPEPRV
ncbi:hypothetical protein IFT59_15190 [Rhizobium sp. CFBP 8752]|uniref:hypothetical protein n=1 Tax=Rhizobium sp. CFBP 8752 TaxID=2775301 RepID=UPI00177F996D|nr:hypothetical protein [Rhizobium sp. CFBP 8752]MBD8664590.1 hypothetical protein [Rhizobium sp. CFBP 8752]